MCQIMPQKKDFSFWLQYQVIYVSSSSDVMTYKNKLY